MRRCSFLLLFLSIAGLNPSQGQDIDVPKNKDSFHLIFLVGQSNMAGRGKVEEQDVEVHPRVLMLNKHNKWVPAKDPMHFDKPKIVGVGLGRTFGIDYAESHPGVTVGLIPCAVGGSPIATWDVGGFHESTKAHPFDDAMSRAKLAMQAGTLKAILWHQGEGDSNEKKAPKYEAKLHELIGRFRTQLNAADVPFIAGQMGQFAERPWNEYRTAVDAVHRGLPNVVPNAAFVNSDGLNHKGDKVHFDAPSYRKFGHRYFKAYQAMAKPVVAE